MKIKNIECDDCGFDELIGIYQGKNHKIGLKCSNCGYIKKLPLIETTKNPELLI